MAIHMLVDQASQLRSLVRQSRTQTRRATVVAITSGKGGVGKSNLAVNLAIALSAAGKGVVLLDADLGLANADVLCNVDTPSNLSHVIARKKELQEVMVTGPGGFRLIAGASGLARMADLTDVERQRLVDSMSELEERADVIIIDTGAGISPNVLTFTQAADHVLVVTTPEPTAITDAYAVVKVISRKEGKDGRMASTDLRLARSARELAESNDNPNRRISLVVNQTRTPSEGKNVYDRIANVASQFLGIQLHDAGAIPLDDAVPSAVRKRSPFILNSPRSEAAQSIHQIAARLIQGTPVESGSFFGRMSKWFRK